MANLSKMLQDRASSSAFFVLSWKRAKRAGKTDLQRMIRAQYVDVVCNPGGASTARPDRAPPRLLFSDKEGKAARQLCPLTSPWYLSYLCLGNSARTAGSLLNTMFRKLFRIPVELFAQIVQDARDSELWPDEDKPERGQKPKPLALKILCVLRVLAVGCDPSAMWEASSIQRPTIQKFMNGVREGPEKHIGFVAWYVQKYGDQIDGFKDQADMESCARVFAGLGLPCCVSSKLPACVYNIFAISPFNWPLGSLLDW